MVAATQQKVKGPRRKIEATCDLTDPNLKRRLCAAIGSLSGWYELSIIPRRNTRSLRQNAWYFGVICRELAAYLSEQDYDVTTVDGAHELLKARFLTVDVVNRQTGEILGKRVRSTTELDTGEFCDYCERARAWMLDFFGILVPDPEPDYVARQPNG